MSKTKLLIKEEAERLYERAPSMTKAELTHFMKIYFGGEWISTATKKTMVNGLRKRLKQHMDAAGPKGAAR